MDAKELECVIEGLLFAAGEAVSVDRIADILEIGEEEAEAAVVRLADKYGSERRGIHVIRVEDSYQMCTRPEFHGYIARLAQPKKSQSLSGAALEVLAVIAYKQPVTRSVIEEIRGVNCDGSVNKLLERGLIEEKGRLDAPGRPILFGTTGAFLKCFGLASLSELPEVEALGENARADLEIAGSNSDIEQIGQG